jgi:hypothetical protein
MNDLTAKGRIRESVHGAGLRGRIRQGSLSSSMVNREWLCDNRERPARSLAPGVTRADCAHLMRRPVAAPVSDGPSWPAVEAPLRGRGCVWCYASTSQHDDPRRHKP